MVFENWIKALTKPKKVFAEEKANASLGKAIKIIFVAGIIAGMSYSSLNLNRDKFIIGLADDSEDATMKKVSARANLDLVKKGVNLGNLIRKGCAEVGGEGRGHSVAAGARITKESVEKFLEILDRIEI